MLDVQPPPPQKCAVTLHPAYKDKLTRTLALFSKMSCEEQEMMLLIMHNWVIGGDITDRLYGVNRILLAHEMNTMDDPHALDITLPPVRVRVLGVAVQELERA